MKSKVFVLAFLFALLLVPASLAEDGLVSIANTNSDKDFFLCYDVSKHGQIRYQYFVFSKTGTVIEDGYEWRFAPEAEFITDEILMLSFFYGPNVTGTKFYHLQNEQISSEYSNVFATTKDYVLYTDVIDNGQWAIIVSSLFDCEIAGTYTIDLAPADGSISSVKWLSESNAFDIYYISQDDYQIKNILIALPVNEM